MNDQPVAGDPIPAECRVIELHVAELRQLFNTLDPAPFHERDLDSRAEEFIVSWARELPRHAPLALLVHLDRPAGMPDEAPSLRNAIHRYFADASGRQRQQLRQLLRTGRTTLVIGVGFLAASIGTSQLLEMVFLGGGVLRLVSESLLIGGWVAMWRPMQIFLYDWWPIREEARLLDRLAAMPVSIRYGFAGEPDAWRQDWPAQKK
jgi:hypothetical protein